MGKFGIIFSLLSYKLINFERLFKKLKFPTINHFILIIKYFKFFQASHHVDKLIYSEQKTFLMTLNLRVLFILGNNQFVCGKSITVVWWRRMTCENWLINLRGCWVNSSGKKSISCNLQFIKCINVFCPARA